MASQDNTQIKGAHSKCRLAEIVQYKCDLDVGEQGEPQVHCWPVPRIFRICAGRPAVELTRFVHMDLNTGEVTLPPETSQQLPKGKPWRDVIRYREKVAEFTGEKL
ncbi:hypothetical protein FOMPIDRAFT_1127382 [Fomitopsis schrenkii]|uniref:Uncharacterized protein n=1 Tax=Fomitopsis schrenkii TaxID=2126942 RepID=S8FHU4_FOMSC|nr:hypothetical protein FOMPIDRAFT_1127382 [Fomitopsis schrenkii]